MLAPCVLDHLSCSSLAAPSEAGALLGCIGEAGRGVEGLLASLVHAYEGVVGELG